MRGRRGRSRRSRQRDVTRYLEKLRSRAYLLRGCREFYRGLGRDPQYWVVRRFLADPHTNHDDVIGALALFLKTWNWMKYARIKHSTKQVEDAIETALAESRDPLNALRGVTLLNLRPDRDGERIAQAFGAFAGQRRLIGSTGASKALHILRPELFVPWDTTIQSIYHRLHPGYWPTTVLAGEPRCRGVKRLDVCYAHFMRICQSAARNLDISLVIRSGHPANRLGFQVYVTKAIDECNYRQWTDEKPWQ